MITKTPNLDLPYIMPGQAQKHVTHNEAIRRLDAITHLSVLSMDVAAPVTDPLEGARYGISNAPTGIWTDHANKIAVWQDGAWAYLSPQEGWTVWVHSAQALQIYTNGLWSDVIPPVPTAFQNLDHVGVNAAADAVNRLSVASGASLFNHDGAGHQMKLNKNAASDTASLLMQTGFSGRAEMGLMGDDTLRLKTSPDGSAWQDQLIIDPAAPGVRTPSLRSGRISVGSDSVVSLPAPAYGGLLMLTCTSQTGYPQADHSGIFVYDAGASLTLLTMSTLAGLDNLGTAALTGTSGAADQTSIAVQTGLIQIENRYIYAREYSYVFLC